jgi:signal transduction histidine kinase
LAAHDLRGIGMSLHGHADHLIATSHDQAAGIATAAADLLDMADDLQDHTVQAGDARVLREEQVALSAALGDAIATVSIGIGPGRRNWRISADLDDIALRFDPRALRHMLSRVLADAVRNTRQDDWIDISLDTAGAAEDLVMVIADEGAGSATPEAGRPVARDSRGIGLRLTLARALMAAHGGRVEVEASAGVGTRVSLVFPASRVRRVPVASSRKFAA